MDLFEKYYALSLKFLSYRQRSEKEIRDYLMRKKVAEETVDQIIAKLKEQRFLNDEEFARMWIESRNRSKPRSKRLLTLELKQKGISDEIIESQLGQVFDGQAGQKLGGKDDVFLAKKVIMRKVNKYKNLPKQEIYKKLGGMLARRGFDWETIKEAIDETLLEEV